MIGTELYSHREYAFISAPFVTASPVAVAFAPTPEGVIHYVERFMYHVSNNRSPAVKIYVMTGDTPDTNMEYGRVDAVINLNDQPRDYASPIFVPPGYRIVANFSNMFAGDVASVTMQRAVCLVTPGSYYGQLSPEEMLALSEQETVEDTERQYATVVAGSGWNLPEGSDQ